MLETLDEVASRTEVSGWWRLNLFSEKAAPLIFGANHAVSGQASNVEVYDLVILQ
jgi:hypothetical protein